MSGSHHARGGVLVMKRRALLKQALGTGVLLPLTGPGATPVPCLAEASENVPWEIVDTNASLFAWPFRRLPLDTAGKLVAKMRALGICSAWAGSFEGILQRDITGVNARVAETCNEYPELTPIGTLNPSLPDWRADLRRCAEEHHMPGIRLYPGYHGYTLGESRFQDVFEQVAGRNLFLQIVVSLEDPRTQPEWLQVRDVDPLPLRSLLQSTPAARVQLLNARPRGGMLTELASVPGLYWDTARLEGTAGVPELARGLPPGRVLFGSHAPFLLPEAALIRVHESNQLSEQELREVYASNARRFLRSPA